MATYYWRGLTGTSWSVAGNWSTGSTSTLGGAVPTNADDCIFDANSSACTVNVASVCRSVNFTAYTRTITMSNSLTLGATAGSNMGLYLGSAMTISGSASIGTNYATGTFQSNGKIWPNALGICNVGLVSNGRVVTVVDDFIVNGNLFLGGGNGNFTLSGSGNFSGYSSVLVTGGPNISTPKRITMLGTGTLSGNQSTIAYLELDVTINSGINTVTVGTLNIQNMTFTYSSGTVNVVSGTTINTGAGAVIWNTNPIVFSNINLGSTAAVTITNTINSNLYISGNLSTLVSIRNLAINGSDLYVSGSCIFDTITSGNVGGTATIRMRGKGLLSATSANPALGNITSPITFESGANTITLRGNTSNYFIYNGGPITYTSGIIDTTTNLVTILLLGATTLNTQGINWYGIRTSAGGTYTLNSQLSANTLTIANTGALTFAGAYGFNVGEFSWVNGTITQTLTLTQLIEYIVRTSIVTRGAPSSLITFTSSDATNRALLTLNNSATQDVGFTSATRIDSSSGQTIYSRRGVLTNTINWQLLVNPSTVAKSFILQ
jgi:hypothetical protein